MQAQARSLSQSISALGTAVRADVEEAAVLREAVLRLVRSAESALHTFKRAHAWREASKVCGGVYVYVWRGGGRTAGCMHAEILLTVFLWVS